ncbi:hypothetical protein COP2_014444 [Malus domestica]
MLKERYFENSEFMSAEFGLAPAYTWRSILWNRELLQKGMRCRIGDNRLVHVFGDAWVPRDNNFYVTSPIHLPISTKLCDLISNLGSWDVGKIYASFEFDELETILSIPLSGTSLDRRIWYFTANGRYTVKIRYWVALESRHLINLNIGLDPLVSQQQMFWKHLWKLKLPPKILHFIWRHDNEIIPTRERL